MLLVQRYLEVIPQKTGHEVVVFVHNLNNHVNRFRVIRVSQLHGAVVGQRKSNSPLIVGVQRNCSYVCPPQLLRSLDLMVPGDNGCLAVRVFTDDDGLDLPELVIRRSNGIDVADSGVIFQKLEAVEGDQHVEEGFVSFVVHTCARTFALRVRIASIDVRRESNFSRFDFSRASDILYSNCSSAIL